MYTLTLTHPTNFDPEDGCSMHRRNVGKSTHIHTMPKHKSRTNVNKGPFWKPKIVNLVFVFAKYTRTIKRLTMLMVDSCEACFLITSYFTCFLFTRSLALCSQYSLKSFIRFNMQKIISFINLFHSVIQRSVNFHLYIIFPSF